MTEPTSDLFASETQYLVSSSDGSPLWLMVEPEGMHYDFPPHERVLLTVKSRRRVQHVELVHSPDGLALWRSGDSEVWATTADGRHEQIAGWADNPAPWIDTGSAAGTPAPWTWPPSPEGGTSESSSEGSTRSGWFRGLFGSGPVRGEP